MHDHKFTSKGHIIRGSPRTDLLKETNSCRFRTKWNNQTPCISWNANTEQNSWGKSHLLAGKGDFTITYYVLVKSG